MKREPKPIGSIIARVRERTDRRISRQIGDARLEWWVKRLDQQLQALDKPKVAGK